MSRSLTWTQGLVTLGVVAVLLLMGYSAICDWQVRNQLVSTISNMKHLHLATQAMADDHMAAGETNPGWPGDTGGTYSQWAKNLVPEYVTTNEFCNLLSCHGKRVPDGAVPATMKDCAIVAYAVGTNSPDDAVFLSTANFTNGAAGGAPLQKSALPFRDKGFAVFHKDGRGTILRARQIRDTQAIGSFVPLLR